MQQLFQKFGLNLKVEDVSKAKDAQIINDCLILQKEAYPSKRFQKMADFKAVVALNLRSVSNQMFFKTRNLETVIAPQLEQTADAARK